MIFYSHKCGQLGNRLFIFAHLIANAAANNYVIVNLSFGEYAKYFQGTSKDLWCRYPSRKSIIKSQSLRSLLFVVNKAILKVLRIIPITESSVHSIQLADIPEYDFDKDEYFELDEYNFKSIASQKPIVFMFGRFFRDFNNFEKYKNDIREFFRPLRSIEETVDNLVKPLKLKADIVIGIHIRGGDYRQFADGKYFFSQDDYYRIMKNFLESVRPKKVWFVLCSNESIDQELFSGMNYTIGTGHFVTDMYTLSACDLIMGPPSSYSLWASFYRHIPLYQIRDKDRFPTLDDFVLLPPKQLFDFSIR